MKKSVIIAGVVFLSIVAGIFAYSVFSEYEYDVDLIVNNYMDMEIDKVEFYIVESGGKELYWGEVDNIEGWETKQSELIFPNEGLTQDGSFKIIIFVEGKKFSEEDFGYFTNGGPPFEEGFIFNIFTEKTDIIPTVDTD